MKRVRAEILSTRRLGAYHSITLVAPEIAERARPGQFLSIAMPEGREFFLRRHFSCTRRRAGAAGPERSSSSSIRADPGPSGSASARAHEFLDVIGPLGQGRSRIPKRLTNCLLVAEGHGAASLYFLAQELARGTSAST